jgi:hypothetical protein
MDAVHLEFLAGRLIAGRKGRDSERTAQWTRKANAPVSAAACAQTTNACIIPYARPLLVSLGMFGSIPKRRSELRSR